MSDGPDPLSYGAQGFCGHPHDAYGRGTRAFVCVFVEMVDIQLRVTGGGHESLLGKTRAWERRTEEAWSEVTLDKGREGEW